ncbi:hypothetical protein SB659_18135 [Arthrobacter sp. SIMBA_036]|uniref:hypothetical protein n=1 Tax=Arthrobacter sp. SIMBA_036 TaxID=3085778 RepID=UPI00397B865D
MRLEDEWDYLHPDTKAWFLNNSGCALVPVTPTAGIIEHARGPVRVGPDGQIELSPSDRAFIRDRAESAGTIRVLDAGYRHGFFFGPAGPPALLLGGKPGGRFPGPGTTA